MSTIDFPSSPFIGQSYIFGNRTWQWNGEGWQRIINAGQIVSVFVLLSPINLDSIAVLPATVDGNFNLVNYV